MYFVFIYKIVASHDVNYVRIWLIFANSNSDPQLRARNHSSSKLARAFSELAASTFGSHRASASVKSLKSFALTLTRRRHQCRYTCLQASAFKARNKQARHVIDYLLSTGKSCGEYSIASSLSLSLSFIYLSIYLYIYPSIYPFIYLTSSLSLPVI